MPSAPRPVALVTGASAGIGTELARQLAPDHDLVLTARRTEALEALAGELRRAHRAACHVVPADLTKPDAPRHLFDTLATAGITIDVLVNNAGFGDLGAFARADSGKLLDMIQVNVTALTELTALFLPGMLARGRGAVLNVGSVAGFQPGPLMAVYYATKAYVNSFSEALHRELRGTGVTVTVLCPGPVSTEFLGVAGAKSGGGPGQALAAAQVAAAGLRAMRAGRRLVVPGWRNRALLALERVLPRGLVIRGVEWVQRRRLG